MTQAIDKFKQRAKAASDYLHAKGIEVPHVTLLEALSRFESSRNWRTHRAQLIAGERGQSADIVDLSFMGDLQIHVVVPMSLVTDDMGASGSPTSVVLVCNRATLAQWLAKMQLAQSEKVSVDCSVAGMSLAPHGWRIADQEAQFCYDGFFTYRVTEYYSDAASESKPVSMAALLELLREASQRRATHVFWNVSDEAAWDLVECARSALENLQDEGEDLTNYAANPMVALLDSPEDKLVFVSDNTTTTGWDLQELDVTEN